MDIPYIPPHTLVGTWLLMPLLFTTVLTHPRRIEMVHLCAPVAQHVIVYIIVFRLRFDLHIRWSTETEICDNLGNKQKRIYDDVQTAHHCYVETETETEICDNLGNKQLRFNDYIHIAHSCYIATLVGHICAFAITKLSSWQHCKPKIGMVQGYFWRH